MECLEWGPMSPLPSFDECYAALCDRDASFEGLFVVGVKTTGIFCRPTCPARKPKRENVEFFADAGAAQTAGFRACMRCKPLQAAGEPPKWVTELLLRLERDPGQRLTETDLRAMDIEPARARRWFREHFGMTFHGYQRALRVGFAHDRLRRGEGLDDAGHGAGFQSQSGFRDAFAQLFGATPGRARATEHIKADLLSSPLGPIVAAATERGVCLVEFSDRRALPGQARSLQRWFDRPVVPGRNEHLEQLDAELGDWFAGLRTGFDVPLETPGTEFQQAVWNELLAIPYGETRSYEEMARRIRRPGAQRAVGRANGQNRVAILVPCHRVIEKSGKLRGYGGGLWRKRWMLDLETRVSAGERPSARVPVTGTA